MKEVAVYFNSNTDVLLILGDHPILSAYSFNRFRAGNVNINAAIFFKLTYPEVRLYKNNGFYKDKDPRANIHF